MRTETKLEPPKGPPPAKTGTGFADGPIEELGDVIAGLSEREAERLRQYVSEKATKDT